MDKSLIKKNLVIPGVSKLQPASKLLFKVGDSFMYNCKLTLSVLGFEMNSKQCRVFMYNFQEIRYEH